MEKFKNYLINEERGYLGHRIGDVLTSLQDVQADLENMGSRQLSRLAENVVNQIRKVLHTKWSPRYNNQLKELQKIGVALQKTIAERGDLKQILPAAVQSLEALSGKIGVKLNNLKAPETGVGGELSPQDFQSTGEQPDFKKKQNPNQQQINPPPNQNQGGMASPTTMTPTGGMPMSGQSALGLPSLNV